MFLTALATGVASQATGTRAWAAQPVSVMHADSLTSVFQQKLAPDFERRSGSRAEGEGRGSVAIAKLIAAGLKTPDVFISADASVTKNLLKSGAVTWYATFATTRLLLAYSPKSPHAARFAEVAAGKRRWYEVLREPGLRIGRSDPATDPKGYRTLIMMQLAQTLYAQPALRESIFGADRNPEQILPDETILARLDQGDLDVAVLYAVQSTSRRLPTIELDPRINLGDSRLAANYAQASVTIEGVERRGEPILYAFTIPEHAANPTGAASFLQYFLSKDARRALDDAGLQSQPPQYYGDLASVPDLLREAKKR